MINHNIEQDRQKNRQADREANRRRGGLTEKQTGRHKKKDRQTDRLANRVTFGPLQGLRQKMFLSSNR